MASLALIPILVGLFWIALIVPLLLIPIISIKILRNKRILRAKLASGGDHELEARNARLKAYLPMLVIIFLIAWHLFARNYQTGDQLDAWDPATIDMFISEMKDARVDRAVQIE